MPDRFIYLDHNATTPLHPEVKITINEMLDIYGNPSSLHTVGRIARHKIEQAREIVANFIGAAPDEIIFVGSGSEANNTVLNSLSCPSQVCRLERNLRDEIITTAIEHPCVLETSKCLRERGTTVNYLPVDATGKVKLEVLKELLTEKTALVSVMYANNEIGTIQDIKTIIEMTHSQGAFFHTDAVQAVGKIPVDIKDLDVDFLTFSAHKIYGPKGVGALYVKRGTPFCPLIRGGHQERGRRAGTENTIGIVAFAKAIEMRKLEMSDEAERLRRFKKMLIDGIKYNIPDVQFNGHPTDALPGTLNVSFAGAEGESILLYLDLEGIGVSTGSACASGSLDPSHVILATGVGAELAHGSIRISMGRENTSNDIYYTVSALERVVKKVRDMSTTYQRKSV
ncbi:MAG TPA: cysteine desulfurase family protein [Candidatus Marinimicrobia bacterium]|nr:cysteine desulfurase family protein [Candidatus Neomarinimicrobiota bacterium]HRS52038.1 cysteine desulfurase family protein [Candidatus Neomarinimicrobiota bacterium]HRU91640.1 cysteine desulfurase family protein [Candidatus Neomarinimicrobiota bacterium]